MSVVNCLVQPRAGVVHVMTDGAAYLLSGILTSIEQKCFALPTLSAAVASTGAYGISLHFAAEIGRLFSTFDDAVENAPEIMPVLYRNFEATSGREFSESQLFFAGWLQKEDRPAAFAMLCTGDEKSERWQSLTAGLDWAPFTLRELDCAGSPAPTAEECAAAGLFFGDDVEKLSPTTLLHLMEIQRRPGEIDARGHRRSGPSYAGGFALLTSIRRDGISQAVVHRWEEDRVGELIKPAPIDWAEWRAAHVTICSATSEPPADLSRVRREMLARKQRKEARKAGGR